MEKFVKNSEREEILAYLEWKYGIAPSKWDDLLLWKQPKSYWAFPKTEIPEQVYKYQFDRIGTRILRITSNSLKPTTLFAQNFGSWVTKNKINLKPDQKEDFLLRKEIPGPFEVDKGFVFVGCGDENLGCGIYREPTLHSEFPKSLYTIHF